VLRINHAVFVPALLLGQETAAANWAL
jgi:hypothetical protein